MRQRFMSAFDSLHGTEAAALLEFAVSLPFLVVLVVGIFDFGGAFNLKQELNNAAREGARFGSTQPSNDLQNPGVPGSVDAIRRVVDSYLVNARINDCGLASNAGGSGGTFVWTFSPATGCGGQQLVLRIDRGCFFQETSSLGNTVNVQCTQVSINYPYQWHFNNVISLLIPGAHLNLLNIQTQATAVNTD